MKQFLNDAENCTMVEYESNKKDVIQFVKRNVVLGRKEEAISFQQGLLVDMKCIYVIHQRTGLSKLV